MKALILISSAMLLTACHSGQVKDCRSWPSGGVASDASGLDVAEYINEGWGAWKSCYEAVRGVK